MNNTIISNAYHILGLDSGSSQKNVIKRSKEIINRLKIDDCPEFLLDIDMFDNYRTLDSVSDATQVLQNPKKKIRDYFFWFKITDNVDKAAHDFIKNRLYDSALNTWKMGETSDDSQFYLYKKNIAILYTLLLFKEDNEEYLEASLLYWKEVMNSEFFWSLFFDLYKLQDESRSSDEIISEFRISSINNLSDIYAELHDIHKNPKYIKKFQEIFSIKSTKVEENVLEPIYHSLNECSEKLYSIKINEENNEFPVQEVEFQKIIETIKVELTKLEKLGLYEDSQSKVLRDCVSEAVRSIAIDIHNKLNDREKSLSILKIALELSGTAGLNQIIALDVDKVSRFIEEDKNDPYKHCIFCDSIITNIEGFIFESMHKVTKVVGKTTHYLTKKIGFPRCTKCAASHRETDKKFILIGLSAGLPIGLFYSLYSEFELLWIIVATTLTTFLSLCVSCSIGERTGSLKIKPKNQRYTFKPYRDLLKDGWNQGAEPSG